jgi:transcriptional regulator with XRE-family HTH domain
MSKLSRDIIGKNIKAIRKKLGLSLLNFSILTELSKTTIVNIETGKNGYNLNNIDSIIKFTKFSLKELSDESFTLPNDFRETIIALYKKHEIFYSILDKKPEIVFAINSKIIAGDFLDTPKEIREIRSYLQNFGWDYKGTSISIALKRMPNFIAIRQHPTKKGTFLYSKK